MAAVVKDEIESCDVDEDTQTEMLLCDVCMGIFRRPRVLPCGHTFCEPCLETYAAKTKKRNMISCIMCRQMHCIPDGGVKAFPANFTIEHLCDALEKKGELGVNKKGERQESRHLKHICQICYVLEQQAVAAESRCLDCDHLLCTQCIQKHKTNVVTSGHSLVPYKRTGFSQPCANHKTEPIKYYCGTCAQCICVMCSHGNHNRHRVTEIANAAQHYRRKVSEQLSKAERKQEQLQQSRYALDHFVNNKNQIAKEIKETTEHLQKNIKRQSERLLEQLETAFQRNCREPLEPVREHVMKNLEVMDNLQRKANDTMDLDDVSFMLKQGSVISELEAFQRVEQKFVPMSTTLTFQPKDKCINLGSISEEVPSQTGSSVLYP